jgi:16S rRNA (guanine527-N7)-methyltransferase
MGLYETLEQQLGGLGLAPDREALDRVERHRDLVLDWNEAAKLVSRADATTAGLIRHYQEAVQALPHLRGSHRIIDLGSGAGFPGLVWSCFCPEKEVVLVEAAHRKAAFLREARRLLGLKLVEVRRARIDDVERLEALAGDLLTTRATAGHSLLLRLATLSHRDRLVLILYRGAGEASRLHPPLPEALAVTAEERLISGTGGRLLVLRKGNGF